MCCPECYGSSAGARALEADFAEVKLAGREVGVGRVVPVEAANSRIAEDNASATVGLQTMLMRIDDNRVCLIDDVKGSARRLIERIGNELEVPAVRGID